MTLFDSFSRFYEAKYSAIVDFMTTFDHSEWLWRMRHIKWAEFQEKRRLQKQIYDKQAQGDEVSQIIIQLDNVREDA